MTKEKIIAMVNSLETDTNKILWITNLLNKRPMYKTYKEVDIQNLMNDEKFKFILRDPVKENRDKICI